jgi:hypothetical protein
MMPQRSTDGMNGWSRVHRHARVPTDLEESMVQVARPGKGCLSHVFISDGDAVVFDPSHYLEEYETVLDEYEADLIGVFDTLICRPRIRRCGSRRAPWCSILPSPEGRARSQRHPH